MNWYIGQEIVCIKTHSQGVVKRGKIYTIKGLQKSRCKCHTVEIDIGAKSDLLTEGCSACNSDWKATSDIWWLSEIVFAPLEYNQDAINELLEQPILIER